MKILVLTRRLININTKNLTKCPICAEELLGDMIGDKQIGLICKNDHWFTNDGIDPEIEEDD